MAQFDIPDRRSIDPRDYEEFNKIRTSFYRWLNLDPLPASTGIQARLCWETLLVEVEVWALCKAK